MKKNFLPEELNLVKAYFPNAEVSFTRNGNIRFVNPENNKGVNWYSGEYDRSYVIGFNPDGFWIRCVGYSKKYHATVGTYRLHHNRETGKYTFETFTEALNYFVKKVNENKINF